METLLASHDLVVAADGVNSAVRESRQAAFGATRGPPPQPLRLARHVAPLPQLLLLLPAERARPLAGARVPVRRGGVHLHRGDDGGGVAGGGAQGERRGGDDRLLRGALQGGARGAPARRQPLHLAAVPDGAVRALVRRAAGAAGRRGAHGALLGRLGHQARHGGRHRALPGAAGGHRRGGGAGHATRSSAGPAWRACSARRRRASSGSRRRSATTTSSRCSSRTACSRGASASRTRISAPATPPSWSGWSGGTPTRPAWRRCRAAGAPRPS